MYDLIAVKVKVIVKNFIKSLLINMKSYMTIEKLEQEKNLMIWTNWSTITSYCW